MVNFTKGAGELKTRMNQYLLPFEVEIKEKELKLKFTEFGDFPECLSTDWGIYEEILSLIVQNAIKFNKKHEYINIELFYYELNDQQLYQSLKENYEKQINQPI